MNINLIEVARDQAAALTQTLDSLLKEARAAAENAKTPALKLPNGRLSEAGVSRLRQLVDANVPDSKIAEMLDITQPAVIHQRNKYHANQH